jgi:hypothetical protein
MESVEGLMNLWGRLPLYALDAQVVGSSQYGPENTRCDEPI